MCESIKGPQFLGFAWLDDEVVCPPPWHTKYEPILSIIAWVLTVFVIVKIVRFGMPKLGPQLPRSTKQAPSPAQGPAKVQSKFIVCLENQVTKEKLYINRGDIFLGNRVDADNGFPTIELRGFISYLFVYQSFVISGTRYLVLKVNIDYSFGSHIGPTSIKQYKSQYLRTQMTIQHVEIDTAIDAIARSAKIIVHKSLWTSLQENQWLTFYHDLSDFFAQSLNYNKIGTRAVQKKLDFFLAQYDKFLLEKEYDILRRTESEPFHSEKKEHYVSHIMRNYRCLVRFNDAVRMNALMAERAGIRDDSFGFAF